ncbi:putative transposase [Vigna unguiculata]|uniref:Putative transposase n=1 Tax=Vigna unguiculata TaxID=3917 RepID=A0A4D6NSH2_VIGUN|nr:putative transposase [Vigna unguiculata]
MWFTEFMRKYTFLPPDDKLARKNFEMRGANILKSSLNKARTNMRKPNWLMEDVWDNLCQHLGSKPFKVKSLVPKANRASDSQGFGISLHTADSISTSQHRENMLNGKSPTPSELFHHTHQRKKDKTWVDQRSAHVDFTCAWEEESQSPSTIGVSPPDELQLWCKVAGINKGKVYGLGSESTKAIGRLSYHDPTSSSVQAMREEIEHLKNELLAV